MREYAGYMKKNISKFNLDISSAIILGYRRKIYQYRSKYIPVYIPLWEYIYIGTGVYIYIPVPEFTRTRNNMLSLMI